MKSKYLRKFFSCLLAGTMLIGSLTGVGTAIVKAEESTGVSYPMDGSVTLTIAYETKSAVTANYADWTETPFWSAWQEATGIKLEAMELSGEQLNLLLSSGELPDLIFMKPYDYPGGPELAILDGVIEPLDAYEEYLPDLMAALEKDEKYMKTSTTDSGNLIGAPFIRGDEFLLNSVGLMIRNDWLEELNLEIPKTPDQLYETLVAFRDEKGAEAALSCGTWHIMNYLLKDGLITNGFGLPTADYYVEDDVVHFGFAEPEIKECFAYLNKLFSEGLMEQDYATWDDAVYKNNIMSGNSGMTTGSVGSGLGTWMKEAVNTNPEYELVGVPSLVEKEGDRAKGSASQFCIPGQFLVMTTQCENKEAAAQFINYGYTEEGAMLFNYGVEGESYEMVDGVPTYTEFVTNNPDGWSMQQALAAYCLSWYSGAFVQQKGYMEQFASLPQQKEAIETWNDNDYLDYQMPLLSIGLEDSAEYSKINSEINTFLDEMMLAYITGAKSLDNFETEYMETLKSLGVDRLIEIQQTAYDKYLAR